MKTFHPETASVLCLLPEVITKAKVKVSITFHLFSTKKGFLLVARNMVFRLFSLIFDLPLLMEEYIIIWNWRLKSPCHDLCGIRILASRHCL